MLTRQERARPIGSMAPTCGAASAKNNVSVLFVCLGNICRSPSAEAVFKAVVEREGVADRFFIDSCGTGGGNEGWYKEKGWSHHEGNPSDRRMQAAAKNRNVHLTSRSRPLTPNDLTSFDYIIGMDDSNIEAITTAARYWSQKHEVPTDISSKVSKMTQYLRSDTFRGKYDEVPDPWYAAEGEIEGFELVLDLLEDASENLLHTTGVMRQQ